MRSPGPLRYTAGSRARWRHAPAGDSAARRLLLVALIAAALINLGFVLQHRGRAAAWRLATRCWLAYATAAWLPVRRIGWAGFALQIVAWQLAPLTLVQAFAAGSLAVSIP